MFFLVVMKLHSSLATSIDSGQREDMAAGKLVGGLAGVKVSRQAGCQLAAR